MNRLVVIIAALSVFAVRCDDSPSTPTQNTRSTSTFTVPLSSLNEVPSIANADAGASGTATITLTVTKDASGTVTSASADFAISVTGFPPGTTVTDAHIHNGAAGANAGIYVNAGIAPGDIVLTNGSGSGTKTGINVPADRATTILNNPAGHYFNVHTALNPAGAIRGQLAGGGATVQVGVDVPY